MQEALERDRWRDLKTLRSTAKGGTYPRLLQGHLNDGVPAFGLGSPGSRSLARAYPLRSQV